MGNFSRWTVGRLLPLLALCGYFALPHLAYAQTQFQTCSFSDSQHCYGIGPGTIGQAYMSNGPSAYPAFSSSLPGVTSVGGVTIPATASEFVTGPTTTTPSQCFLSTTTAGLGSWGSCPGGGTPGGTTFELQYNNSGSFGGIALGTLGYPLLSDGSGGAPAFGQLDLTLGVTNILPVANGGTGTASPGLIAGTNVTITGTWPNQTINATGGGGGVSSVTGDGTLVTNSASTGGVTLALGNTGVGYGVWGNTGAASGAPGYHTLSAYPLAAFPSGLAQLATVQAWSGAQTFPSSDVLIKGSSTGTTAIASANSSATNYTATLPAASDTVVELTQTQTLTNKSIAATEVNSGTLAAAQMPALTGDVTSTAGTVATTVGKINGGTVPTSAALLATNSSAQPTAVSVGAGLVISSGTLNTTVPNRTVTTSPTVLSTDMGGVLVMNVSGGGTLTIPAIGSGIFGAGQSLFVVNYSASTATVSTTPTINSGGGCVSGTGIPAGDAWQLLSNGTTLDCVQTTPTSSGGGGSPSTPTYSIQYDNAGAFGGVSLTAGTVLQGTGTGAAPTATATPTLGVSGTTAGSLTLASSTAGGSAVIAACSTCSSALTFSLPNNSGGTFALANVATTISGTYTFSAGIGISKNGAASTSPESLTGSLYTGGTGTTTFPYWYYNVGATAPTTFSTNGTLMGANFASGFTGRIADWYINGTEVAKLSTYGNLTSLPNAATSATSVTPNCEYAFVKVTASATGTLTVNAPGTCTPVDGQRLEMKVISPAGGTITYAWNAAYLASATLALPTTSNAASKEDYFAFQYDSDKSGWVFLADNQGF